MAPGLQPRLLRGGRDGGDNGGMPDLDARVKEIKGKICQMPTTFQMEAWFVGVSLGLVALVFAVARALR